MPPLVYALCDHDTVAETLAILLERECAFHALPADATSHATLASLPRPALLIDARRALQPSLSNPWPALRVLRCTLRNAKDSFTIRRRVGNALRVPAPRPDLAAAVTAVVTPLAAELRPRLIATRALLAIAADAPPPVFPLLHEQIVAIRAIAVRTGCDRVP